MKTFDQYVSEMSHAEAVYNMTSKLVENGVDPVLYTYLRLVENVPPAQAAVGAPIGSTNNNLNNEIGPLAQAVNGILTKYGKSMPNVGKVATNLNKEVQNLTAAAQQDAAAQTTQQQPQQTNANPVVGNQAGQQPVGIPGQQQQAPGRVPVPGQQPTGTPGQQPVPGQQQKFGQQIVK